ncbi:hypothetical protein Lesp02_65830 [Lentzea sp. NBRC 105346]|uniref:hypothetical protein n=1 Tax=Lentzea sp. NBRC 105346 TaxID=3032205 RepID=UPI0024A1766E|nr:hypothetical protein [Lentzea sp. NBRC 105346]GLZ34396.1 hypothetical protein Lesp02_65830 [Lentzea sp. NBRC 105346]
MTSIAEVKVVLEQVCEQLRESYAAVRGAQQDLDEAVTVLAEQSENHHESLLPAEFLKAKERFPELLELVVTTLERIQRISVEL